MRLDWLQDTNNDTLTSSARKFDTRKLTQQIHTFVCHVAGPFAVVDMGGKSQTACTNDVGYKWNLSAVHQNSKVDSVTNRLL